MNCLVCGIDISDKKVGTKTCSVKCRKDLSHLASVTDNVTLSEIPVTLNFEFYTLTKGREPYKGEAKESDQKSGKRTAKYWYDVPLGAIPIIQKDWPQMPDFMNGRQYFLWWKNEFKLKDGVHVIHNPFPERTKLDYYRAGDNSRRWGA